MDVLQAFADLVNRPDGEIDLARAAAMIGMRDYPELDLDAVGRSLDGYATGVNDLDELRRRLFTELGFRGDDRVYYHVENSYLHRVIEHRRGIPVTLCVLTLEVGRRAGIPLQAIGMPAHVLLRDPLTGVYLDPFHGGAVLDEAGCELVFRKVTGAGTEVAFSEALLPPLGPAEVLERILGNLALLHRTNADPAALEWTLRMRLALPEVTADDVVALADAVAEQGRAGEAAAELEAWAELSPQLAPAVRRAARRILAQLN